MRWRDSLLAVLAAFAGATDLSTASRAGEHGSAADTSQVADSAGVAAVEWAFDRWSVPWVQVAGGAHVFDPMSSATLMALECETAELERDRLVRHLSPEECEHRMSAIRAGQDSSLLFRLDLRVIDAPAVEGLARLGPKTSIWLEDNRGRHWYPVETLRGPVVGVLRGERLRRVYDYYVPTWARNTRSQHPYRYEPYGGRPVTIAEHRARFARRDRRTSEPLIARSTRWLRLHLKYGSYEWVATWAFRSDFEALEPKGSMPAKEGGVR